ncbi:hypothetical protein QCA50_015441 [Cerrena zonata]|uniref:C2H2-type domain-containing protein n=1 Tax=Cerrena zonata TaxID=2478898 RepID=A0AAW0FQZ2_9APHY
MNSSPALTAHSAGPYSPESDTFLSHVIPGEYIDGLKKPRLPTPWNLLSFRDELLGTPIQAQSSWTERSVSRGAATDSGYDSASDYTRTPLETFGDDFEDVSGPEERNDLLDMLEDLEMTEFKDTWNFGDEIDIPISSYSSLSNALDSPMHPYDQPDFGVIDIEAFLPLSQILQEERDNAGPEPSLANALGGFTYTDESFSGDIDPSTPKARIEDTPGFFEADDIVMQEPVTEETEVFPMITETQTQGLEQTEFLPAIPDFREIIDLTSDDDIMLMDVMPENRSNDRLQVEEMLQVNCPAGSPNGEASTSQEQPPARATKKAGTKKRRGTPPREKHDDPFKCFYFGCPKTFRSCCMRDNHLDTHFPRIQCPTCKKLFAWGSALRHHFTVGGAENKCREKYRRKSDYVMTHIPLWKLPENRRFLAKPEGEDSVTAREVWPDLF